MQLPLKWVLIVVFFTTSAAHACLRDSADARAIQWSTAIVRAKLTQTGPEKPGGGGVPVVGFEVLESLDGSMKAGERFTLRADQGECMTKLSNDAIGQTFVLLLRSPQLVTLVEEADQTAIDELKKTIVDVRKAEAAVTAEEIQTQVGVLASAQDDTEAEHAEEALRQIGPKALPALADAMKKLGKDDELAKRRLQELIADLTPPPLPIGSREE